MQWTVRDITSKALVGVPKRVVSGLVNEGLLLTLYQWIKTAMDVPEDDLSEPIVSTVTNALQILLAMRFNYNSVKESKIGTLIKELVDNADEIPISSKGSIKDLAKEVFDYWRDLLSARGSGENVEKKDRSNKSEKSGKESKKRGRSEPSDEAETKRSRSAKPRDDEGTYFSMWPLGHVFVTVKKNIYFQIVYQIELEYAPKKEKVKNFKMEKKVSFALTAKTPKFHYENALNRRNDTRCAWGYKSSFYLALSES